MAITVTGFPLGWVNVLENGIDIEGANTLRITLHTATFTPDRDTMDFEADLTNELTTANGYTVGGVTLTNVAISFDSATDQIRFDFDDPSWTFSGDVTWRYAVVWINTAGADTTDPLLLLFDWGSSQTLQGVYSITIPAEGIYAFDMT